mmetsp:Transcript_12362/g.22477  ORF Transcript_12362/g.22477 Transcript_12362/m.22477 type:complete len:109 (+) Transcript_12362:761-1087(+)
MQLLFGFRTTNEPSGQRNTSPLHKVAQSGNWQPLLGSRLTKVPSGHSSTSRGQFVPQGSNSQSFIGSRETKDPSENILNWIDEYVRRRCVKVEPATFSDEAFVDLPGH